MYFVPLAQLESVELLIHSLKAAAGEADCKMCPAYKVCMKQCLTIAGSVEEMLQNGTIPQFGGGEDISDSDPDDDPPSTTGGNPDKGGLRIVK